jgi:hypothetical protein
LTTLFRPVGLAEFELIRTSGYRQFPPRLAQQPYFYPVLNLEYATQIARDWNAKDAPSGSVGYVLKFQVESEFLNRYQVRQVGDVTHREYWIPAEDLSAFNEKIVGVIEVLAEYRGEPA